MAQTLIDETIGSTWVSLNSLTGISIGTSFIITNKGVEWLVLAEGTEPSAGSNDGVYLTDVSSEDSSKLVTSGSLEIWAKSLDSKNNANINIQVL